VAQLALPERVDLNCFQKAATTDDKRDVENRSAKESKRYQPYMGQRRSLVAAGFLGSSDM
jgi:hypothetical protein